MQKNITLIGAGLVGSLLSMYLAKRGHKVDILRREVTCVKQDMSEVDQLIWH